MMNDARIDRRVLGTILAVALLLTGCSALGLGDDEPDPVWVERELSAPSENVAWQVTLRSLSRLKFPLASGLERDRLIAQTGWRNSLAPFKDEGFRQRATVELEPLGEGNFNVRVRVQKQRNRSLVHTLDLRYADWEWEEDDEREAAIVMLHLRTYLDTELPVGERE